MFGSVVEKLLERGLTSVQEIERVTGRGRSTVYRWMRGETEPSVGDLQQLLRGMRKPEAQRTALSLLTSDLPVVIDWYERANEKAASPRHNSHAVLQSTIDALDRLTQVLIGEQQMLERGQLTQESYIKLVDQMDSAVRSLTDSRILLHQLNPDRRRAQQQHSREKQKQSSPPSHAKREARR